MQDRSLRLLLRRIALGLPLIAVLALGLSLATPGMAAAQQWGVPQSYQVVPPLEDVAPVPTHNEPRTRALIAGVSVLAAGYVGAIAWASYVLARMPLGVLSCNDTYAGWHFLPVLGPVLGMGLGGQCLPDGLHVEEAVLPTLFSLVELIGTIVTIIGAVGHSVPDDMPQITISADGNGARGSVTWTF